MRGRYVDRVPVAITELPPSERPRERLRDRGPKALSEAELLALVIGAGTKGRSALDVARELLVEWGGLGGLATSAPEELAARHGIGPARAAALVGALELSRRARVVSDRAVVRRQADLGELAVDELAGLRRERVIAVVLGPGNRLRRVVAVADGAAEWARCPVRDVLNAVLRNDGIAFAVAHNHPSGDPTPSERDLRMSGLLVDGARATGLRFLDHIVVGADEWRSAFADADRRSGARGGGR